ncbi:hypothetical protein GQ600_16210 [Phytophthora cactorum]|nr:hypothetical protein GQ600_16210 [Phytophthora cactorum]
MLKRGERSIRAGAAIKKSGTTKQVPYVDTAGALGHLSARRHENDRWDIADIQLLPTAEECLSRMPPLVPGNFPFHENATCRGNRYAGFLKPTTQTGLITSRSKAPRCFVVAGRLLGVMTFWSIGLMGVMAVIIPADSQRGRTGIRMFGRGI